jgi:hypothetical protein
VRYTQAVKRIIAFFAKGSNSDASAKFPQQGNYYDARNMSIRSTSGNDNALEDTGGEQLLYGQFDSTYECIGNDNVFGHYIEVFCSIYGTSSVPYRPVRFRIDGQIMIETPLLDFDVNHPIQKHKNERCSGGEWYTTDDKNPPYIWDLQDIIDCFNSTDPIIHATYFANFNPLLYQAILNTTPHHPIFTELQYEGGSGLLPGKYSYSIQYADSTGNLTSWSVQTPYIPVPAGNSMASPQHPGIKTYGAAPSATPTNWAIRIQFRVDNIAQYEYIRIRRVRQYTGQGYPYVPTPEYLILVKDAFGATVDILNNASQQFTIITFQDDNSQAPNWKPLSDQEDTDQTSTWFTAKAVRYYNNRLVFMNITTQSRDVSGKNYFIEKNGRLGFPVMEKLTTDTDRRGHYNPWNQVYYPTEQTGEKCGWGVYFMDDFGSRSFVVPIDDLVGHTLMNYQAKDRRDSMDADTDSKYWSVDVWKGAAIASDKTSYFGSSHPHTYEVIDLVGAIGRDNVCAWKNITNQHDAYKRANKVNGDSHNWIPNEFDPPCDQGQIYDILGIDYVNTESIGYQPFHPTKDTDQQYYDHNFRINDTVDLRYGTNPLSADFDLEKIPYNPKGFAPNYYAQGLALWGIKNKPLWAKAMSIVKTKPAGRVICQGVGFYSIDIYRTGSTYKNQNEILFWSPDADSNYHGTVTWQEIADGINSKGYQIQLVAPMGAFTEIYDGNLRGIISLKKAYDIDMMVYIRQLHELGECNPLFVAGNNDGYVSFGRWLNNLGYTQAALNYPDYTYNGQASVWTEPSQRSSYLKITGFTNPTTGVPENIYNNGFLSHSNQNSSNGVENLWDIGLLQISHDPHEYCEPFYIINIIAPDAVVSYGNTTDYVETGNLLKFESRIGIGGGVALSCPLVDERWEDCIPNYLNGGGASENRYVYVDNLPWLNVTYISATNQVFILNQLVANGYYYVPDVDTYGNAMTVRIYGVYQHLGNPGTTNSFTIQFNIFNPAFGAYPQFFIPGTGKNVTVKYDDRTPIKIFAGEKTVGESVWCAWDRTQKSKMSDIAYHEDQMPLGCGFPFAAQHINDRVYIELRTAHQTLGQNIQDYNNTYSTFIRQLMINCHLEATVNVPLMFDTITADDTTLAVFPHTHYVMRPHGWSNNNSGGDAHAYLTYLRMFPEYYDDYGREWEKPGWKYGGFRFPGALSCDNIDYAKYLNDRDNTSTPIVGFKEETHWCTRTMYSQERKINVQNDPNLKSFPSGNIFDIDDSSGEIKYAYSCESQKGDNLWAICDSGYCLLITNKTTLTDMNVNNIAYIAESTGFITAQYWPNRNIGCEDQFWRGMAEYSNELFMPNSFGIYKMSGQTAQIADITPNRNTILLPLLKQVGSGYTTKMCATFDVIHEEYWLNLWLQQGEGDLKTWKKTSQIYSNGKGFWTGYSDVGYEKMCWCNSIGGVRTERIVGTKNYEAYTVGDGTIIDGVTRVCEVTFHVCLQPSLNTEIVDSFINSLTPTKVYAASTLAAMPECETDGSVIRDYGSSKYMMFPRKTAPPRDRLQGDAHWVKIVYSGGDKYVISDVDLGLKLLR